MIPGLGRFTGEGKGYPLQYSGLENSIDYTVAESDMTEQLSLSFPGGSVLKNLTAMQELQEAWVQSLGWEDPLEEEIATHFSILAWKIPWTEEPGRL